MPQPSRGVIKAPVVEAATHRVCLSDITTSCDLDSRTAAHGKARTVTLESYRNTLRPAHGAKCGCLSRRDPHSFFGHEHLSFRAHHADPFHDEPPPGQIRFRNDIDLLFARNGIAFTLGDDMRVHRLGPPEARSLISDFTPNSGDRQLDAKLNDAMTRFLSRAPGDRRDALEKLWDAFEMVKHIESGGQTQNVKQSVTRLLDRAASGPLRAELEAEFNSLNKIGNNFSIRHHGGQQQTLPTDAAVEYVFVRLASVIAFVLRQTGRLI